MSGLADIRSSILRFRRQSGVPAAGACVLNADRSSVACVDGYRRRGHSEQVELDDVWHLGSCTKSITAALWARLVELRYTEWRVPISDVFSDIGDIDPAWSKVTIRDALQCRAGFPKLNAATMRRMWLDSRALIVQRSDVARVALRGRPMGSGRYRYSNLSYMVVGAAVDRVAGISYEDALTKYLLDPLGIESLGYGAPAEIRGHGPRLRMGSIAGFYGRPVEPTETQSDNPPVFSSAGTAHSVLYDWAELVRILLPTETFLRESSLDEIFRLPSSDRRGMSMGWMPLSPESDDCFIMQGSNTLWTATAIVDRRQARASLVVCNDGRPRVGRTAATFAMRLLVQ